MFGAFGGSAAPRAGKDAGLGAAGRVARQPARCARSSPPFGDEISSPVPYPATSDFSADLAGLAAMLAAGMPIRCAALTAPGSYDTHDDQAGELRPGLRLTCDSSSPSSATSRHAGSPTGC